MDGSIYIQRLKDRVRRAYPLAADEVTLLQQLRQQYPDSCYLFPNERGEYRSQGVPPGG